MKVRLNLYLEKHHTMIDTFTRKIFRNFNIEHFVLIIGYHHWDVFDEISTVF